MDNILHSLLSHRLIPEKKIHHVLESSGWYFRFEDYQMDLDQPDVRLILQIAFRVLDDAGSDT